MATNPLAEILTSGDTPEAVSCFIIFLLLMGEVYALNVLFSYIGTCLIVGVTENTIFDLRKKIDQKLSKLPFNYYDTNSYGDILSRVINDVDTVICSDLLLCSYYHTCSISYVVIESLLLNRKPFAKSRG